MRGVSTAPCAGIDHLCAEVFAGGNPTGVKRYCRIFEQFCCRDQIIVLARGEVFDGFAAAFVKEQEFNGVKSLEFVGEVVYGCFGQGIAAAQDAFEIRAVDRPGIQRGIKAAKINGAEQKALAFFPGSTRGYPFCTGCCQCGCRGVGFEILHRGEEFCGDVGEVFVGRDNCFVGKVGQDG